ncbi:MAG TPA: SusC/RagA family TonB-linked outer membrane protein [Prolixibacteraceae bacterium]|nr:SusC/RagA family TonB-linked outer membrane protein [Prolixibacteraceae bacterium]
MNLRRIFLLCFWIPIFNFSFSQNITISGKVSDVSGKTGIAGVTVLIKGTQAGTVTGTNGEFLIKPEQANPMLVFSYVGMKTKEVVADKDYLEVILEPDRIGIDEVIAIGYQSRVKKTITGSVYQVNSELISETPVTSFDQALQGKIPGLVVSSPSGTPGTMQDIRIRGVGSILASNQPLFVIDGVPVINTDFTGEPQRSTLGLLASLSIQDIQSVTVLKDASATSAFGARGSNGVIVITTKNGSYGKTQFSVNSSVGFQNNTTDGLKVLNGIQREELMLEAVHNTFDVPLDEAYDFLIKNNLTTTLKTWVETYNRNESNWKDLLTNKNAMVQNYSISASGSDGDSRYYASLGYNNTESTVIENDFSRISGRLGYQRNFTPEILFSANIMVSNTRQDAILEQSAYYGNPVSTRYLMSPWEQAYLADGKTINTATTSSFYNALYLMENDLYENDLTRGLLSSSLEWKITNQLSFKTLYSGDYNIAAFHAYQNRVHGDGKPKGGSAIQSVIRNYNWVSQNSLDYLFLTGENNLAFKILVEYQENRNNSLSGSGEKFPANGLYYLSSASSNLDANAAYSNWKNLSYLGMVNYNFKDKYIVDLTFRNEGSSLFAPGMRHGNFWSGGTAWNVSEEKFMAGIRNLNVLRLRVSYGLSGNSAIGVNQYQALLSYDRSYAGEGAVYPKQIGNPELTWEKNRNFDAGFDYSFFDGRLKGFGSWYHRYTFDLLQMVPLSHTTGHEAMLMNVGSLVNRGFEGEVTGEIINVDNFSFSAGVNFATVENEVKELAKDAAGNEINIENATRKVATSHPLYGWYMRKWAGVNPENGKPQWFVNGIDGEVTESYNAAKKEWQGESAMPKVTAALTTHTGYRNFYIDVNFYYAGGHKIYEDLSILTHHSGYYTFVFYNGTEKLMDRWQNPGDVTDIPKVVYGASDDSKESTRFLLDGDYIRMKDLVLGYRVPEKVIKQIGFENIDIYLRGTNLLTYAKEKNLEYDPETGADGMTRFTTPPVKSIVFGINLNF